MSFNATINNDRLPAEKGIILFDGECSFCSNTAAFIIARDSADYFRFATLKSEIGEQLKKKFGIGVTDSIILIENGKHFMKSTAVLRIARRLDSFWACLYVFVIVPGFIRNTAYDAFAKSRYSLFGRQNEACLLLTPDLRQRFLDVSLRF